jgi:hypothetical protein
MRSPWYRRESVTYRGNAHSILPVCDAVGVPAHRLQEARSICSDGPMTSFASAATNPSHLLRNMADVEQRKAESSMRFSRSLSRKNLMPSK